MLMVGRGLFLRNKYRSINILLHIKFPILREIHCKRETWAERDKS